MKKATKLIVLLLAMAMLLTACGGASSSAPAASTPAAGGSSASTPAAGGGGASQQLNMVTGSTGGTYYALGGAMATSMNKRMDGIQVSAISSGASVENMNLLDSGEADLGMAMNSIADAAWNGNDPFPGEMHKFRTIGVVYQEVYQLVATAASGAKTVNDLAGLRFAIGPAGSGGAVLSEYLLNAAGMSLSDINAQQDSFSDAGSKMQDGHLDASAAVLACPAAAITELETSLELNYIEVSDSELETIQKDYPFYTRYVIPAGTYKNTEDWNTITCQAALYCREDLDEETVYQLTKSFYESRDEIAAAHSAGNDIDIEKAMDGITTPFHPGAVKYFEELGMTVPADLK